MPPAAQFDLAATALEEPYNSVQDIGCIEVEAVHDVDAKSVITRIRLLPRESVMGDANPRKSSTDESRFAYFSEANEKCLADSFDSVDEIEENSNEAKLIKSIAAKATVLLDGVDNSLGDSANSEDHYFLGETEAKYLDVLDRHLEDTEPESLSFPDMENAPDDPHPKKNMANMEQIMEHLLDHACCECAPVVTRPLKSALRPSRWTDVATNDNSFSVTVLSSSRSVQFKEVDIKEFKMTLGNHPSATSGPPVMLDWETIPSTNVVGLETYEQGRMPRRSRRQLRLSLQERHNILVKERGFTFEEVKGAWQEALEIRKKRKETLERGLALMKWDEVWESTCRKFGRLVDGSI